MTDHAASRTRPRLRFLSADAAAALISNGSTVAISGCGGGMLEPDALLKAIEDRFLRSALPKDLTVLHSQGIGDTDRRGLNRLAHQGLVSRVIGAHWSWSPRMQALAAEEKLAAYALPGGAIQHLIREIGAGRPGLITPVGLATMADPRLDGGRMNRSARELLNEVIVIDGAEYLRYKPLTIDVAVVRGARADSNGNISFAGEGAELDALVLATAARNCGGIVLAQVRERVAAGSIPAHEARLPAALVDAVVVVPDQRWSHAGDRDAAMTADAAMDGGNFTAERAIIAVRGCRELQPDQVVSFGFGIPDGVARLAAQRADLGRLISTLDHGHYGGQPLQGALFGFVPNGEAMIDSPAQFDFYSGGGIDTAVLGFGEFDRFGNVNVSKLAGKIIGPGGFIDIAHGAKHLVFCGPFETKGLKVRSQDGRLQVLQPGSVRKLVADVQQTTFSGANALRRGQQVVYVTERAVFRLAAGGIVLTEVAPGVDLERDILARMGFAPIIPEGGPRPMPAECFRR